MAIIFSELTVIFFILLQEIKKYKRADIFGKLARKVVL
jgi:hypothetical protein